MQLRGVSRALLVAVSAMPLTGCAALGLGAGPDAAGTAGPGASGDSWVVVATGSATPSAAPSGGVRSQTPAPGMSPRPADPDCASIRPAGQVLIPVTVTPGARSLSVRWPRDGGSSTYRVTAVPQDLVSGDQPPVVWQSVAAGTGCTVSASITGLVSGKPYVVWLDAPGTGYLTDGARNPYSGRSGVVYPR
ncbi:MAG TPA: hypothetical protein VF657_16455 [Actinoplanes sp.]